jgi:hypothetical protein
MDAAARKALDIVSLVRLEDGQRWADTCAQFQRDNAAAILSTDGPLQTWCEAPRGARKTTDIAAILLAILTAQAPPMSRSYVGASDLDQAMELVDAARGLVERTEELRGEFTVTELTITSARTGASVTALPADASAFGKRAYLIILDEIANWPETRKARRFWSVLMSGNRKLRECRTIVITNSGDPSHWSFRRRETARTSPHWQFFSVPGPLEWLTETDLASLRENSETPSDYERLVLNKWAAAEDRLATRADLEACQVLPGPLLPQAGIRYVIALDLGTVRDATVMSVLHAEDAPGGRKIVLDRILRWHGSKNAPVDLADVRDTLIATSAEYNRASAVADPWQAKLLTQEAAAAGVDIHEYPFTSTSVGRIALTLHQQIRQHRLELPTDDEELADELLSVRVVKNGAGTWRLDHDASGHDDQAVSIGLGCQWLLGEPSDPVFIFADHDRPYEAGDTDPSGKEILRAMGPFGIRIDYDDDPQDGNIQRRIVRTAN